MYRPTLRAGKSALALLITVLVSGCSAPAGASHLFSSEGSGQSIGGSSTGPSVSPITTRAVDVAREFPSSIESVISEVAAEHGAIVVGIANSSEEIPGNATPNGVLIDKNSSEYVAATRTYLNVVNTLFGGVVAGSELKVRQHGAPNEVLSALPKMRDGGTYLVFLKPFEYVPGKSTGDWTVIGLDAIWQRGGSGQFRLATSADGSALRYPETLGLADAQGLVDRIVG